MTCVIGLDALPGMALEVDEDREVYCVMKVSDLMEFVQTERQPVTLGKAASRRASYGAYSSTPSNDEGGRRKGDGAREGVPECMLSVRRPPRKGLVLGVTYWLGSALLCSDAGCECAAECTADACPFAGDSAGCTESESEEMGDGESSWPTCRR